MARLPVGYMDNAMFVLEIVKTTYSVFKGEKHAVVDCQKVGFSPFSMKFVMF
jgi:hypothetical protein